MRAAAEAARARAGAVAARVALRSLPGTGIHRPVTRTGRQGMLKVALTGNIASGKTTVAAVWRALGARLVEADELARRAVAPGSEGLRRIVDRWGAAVLDRSGSLDRAALRQIVFSDAAARAELEAIIHPRVAAMREAEFAEAERSGASVVVADIPLLYEVGLEDDFDLVVLVDAPAALRKRRIVENRGVDADEAERMIGAQMPSAEKRSRADIVIENEGSLAALRETATSVWRELLRRAEERS